ncbi:hypothetical protein C1886_19100 [Pseudomonas sp. FW300-N1A1]|nr:hypothetical protein C1886_19100 [Pseudomonas sp. FW300-N1A1]
MARELAPAGSRSGPKIIRAAAQPSGSKLPRHNYTSTTPQNAPPSSDAGAFCCLRFNLPHRRPTNWHYQAI